MAKTNTIPMCPMSLMSVVEQLEREQDRQYLTDRWAQSLEGTPRLFVVVGRRGAWGRDQDGPVKPPLILLTAQGTRTGGIKAFTNWSKESNITDIRLYEVVDGPVEAVRPNEAKREQALAAITDFQNLVVALHAAVRDATTADQMQGAFDASNTWDEKLAGIRGLILSARGY